MAEHGTERAHYIVVGVTPGQPDDVLIHAAELAERFDAELVCANVDVSRYTVEELPDGSVSAFPIDPDQAEIVHDVFDPSLAEHVGDLLGRRGVRWSTRELAGEPAHELGRLADELDAHLIVVGTHRPGLRGSAREFFTGSLAAHLSHRQRRPVVVIPLTPVPHDRDLPWS